MGMGGGVGVVSARQIDPAQEWRRALRSDGCGVCCGARAWLRLRALAASEYRCVSKSINGRSFPCCDGTAFARRGEFARCRSNSRSIRTSSPSARPILRFVRFHEHRILLAIGSGRRPDPQRSVRSVFSSPGLPDEKTAAPRRERKTRPPDEAEAPPDKRQRILRASCFFSAASSAEWPMMNSAVVIEFRGRNIISGTRR